MPLSEPPSFPRRRLRVQNSTLVAHPNLPPSLPLYFSLHPSGLGVNPFLYLSLPRHHLCASLPSSSDLATNGPTEQLMRSPAQAEKVERHTIMATTTAMDFIFLFFRSSLINLPIYLSIY